MDFKFITDSFVPEIVVACLVVGYVIKVTPFFKKVANGYIPLIVCILGAILGGIVNGYTVDGIVFGAVSGLASTGMHQMFTRFINKEGEINDRHE